MASPSSLLQSLSQSRTPTTFNNVVLAKYLCPALDALPADQRTNILRILQEAERASCHEEPLHFDKLVLDSDSDDDHHVESVDFELHSRTIKALLATRASTQIIAEQITNWLSLLWRVGAEHGLESKGVHSALAFCMDVDCDALISLEITNSKKHLVYINLAPVNTHIAFVWRDLLIKRLSVGDIDTTTAIVRALVVDDIDGILAWFPDESDKEECHLQHWNKTIKDVVMGRLKEILQRVRDELELEPKL